MRNKNALTMDSNDSSRDGFLLTPIEISGLTASSGLSSSDRCKRPRKRPKVEAEWSDANINKLIKLIKGHRPIWDKGSTQYKISKEFLWREIEQSFDGKYPISECKAKWANLRVTFNTNLTKFRNIKSHHKADDRKKINWRFYKAMLFLESTDVRQSTQPTSSMDEKNADTDESISAEIESSAEPRVEAVISRSTSTSLLDTERTRTKLIASPTSFLSPTQLPNFNAIADQALVPMSTRETKNKYDIFGEYIASELKSLPRHQAEYVQRKLNRTFLDLMDELTL